MNFPRAQPGVVRSIRHVSLIKDWTRARRADALPHFSDFVPDERAGDSADLLIAEVHGHGSDALIYCRSAGSRLDRIFDRRLGGRYLRESMDPKLSQMARPVWDACLSHGLPLCSILQLADRDGCPVTMEQIYLPYRSTGQHVEIVVAAVHAWSPEGRFAIDGLLGEVTTAPQRTTYMIDPALSVAIDRNDAIELS